MKGNNEKCINNTENYWLNNIDREIIKGHIIYDNHYEYNYKKEQISFNINYELSQKLLSISNNSDPLLHILLCTGLFNLLFRYNSDQDITIGTTVDTQKHTNLINRILPLRHKIDKRNSFKEMIFNVKDVVEKAIENQNYPIDNLLHKLHFEVKDNKYPLFNITIILEDLQDKTYLEDINTDMNFIFRKSDNNISLLIEYNCCLYNEKTINRTYNHFCILLENSLRNIESLISDIDYKILPDHDNISKQFKASHEKLHRSSIVENFYKNVQNHYNDSAIIYNNSDISYGYFADQSQRIGSYLRQTGINKGDVIAVCMEKSPELLIIIWGIMSTGGVYLPIDADLPFKRIEYILNDSNSKLLISDSAISIPVPINISKLHSDKLFNSIENQNKIDFDPLSGNDGAYIIYTSGSTGMPKGVLVNHQALENYVNWGMDTYLDENIKYFPLFTSISFDLTLTSIFIPLISFNTIVIYSNKSFKEMIDDNQIDIIKLTPSHLRILNDIEINPNCKIRKIIVGGEKFNISIAKKTYLQFLENIEIYNEYGPTEATIGCMIHKYTPEDNGFLTVPIGRAINNVNIYLLDNKLNHVSTGSIGELYISGLCLVEGYYLNKQLTEERFISDPFQQGFQMYKSGDLCRRMENGDLEFIERHDEQIKINGYRIELREIQYFLSEYETIKDAVVTTKIINDKSQLCAYYISEKEIATNELVDFLDSKLPQYMIPHIYIRIESIPLTDNGKINIKNLPFPELFSENKFTPPRNDRDQILLKIWKEVLNLDEIGIDDNFFLLGVDSIVILQLQSRLQKVGFVIETSLFFQKPTIREISDILYKNSNNQNIKRIEAVEKDDSYKLSHAQMRLWILNQIEENSVVYNTPGIYFFEGVLNKIAFEKSFNYIIDRHESLRTVFTLENGEPRQKILEKPDFYIKYIDLKKTTDKEKKLKLLVEEDLSTPFNLEKGPLLRLKFIEIEDEKNLLVLNMHHIISDGWSMNIFVREFLTFYNSFKEGINPEFEALSIHYKDYSVWQNNLMESGELRNQKNYWLEKLSGKISIIDLPSDKPRPLVQTFNGKHLDFNLSREIITGLNNLCIENNVSLFMMLQAIAKVLLYRYSGQTDIILGSPVAGRNHQDLESQIGFYVNTLVLRDIVKGDLGFIELLKSVKQTCTEAFDNQSYPFDRIVEDLDIKRGLSRSPLFDVMLVLQNNETTAIEFDGLNVSPYETESLVSKFDMTFNFVENEGSLFCSIEYNTDIYNEDRIKRMADHLEILISSVLDNPEARIKDLEIIPEEEKDLLLNVFNDSKADYPKDKTIVDLFEEQVEKTPDNVAVVFEEVELTYRELNKKANIVGHYLIDHYDIKPDDLVGVLLERSEKMIIALLGILKSGAGYVPIDPGYPDERIDYILSDSYSKLVISDNSEGINIDIKEILNSGCSMDNPENNSTPKSLAYVLYTSGSTGKPKGVMVLHNNIIRLVSNQVFTSFKSDDKLLLTGSISFDISTYEIWAPLINNVQIILTKKENTLNTVKLGKVLLENNITVLHLIPQLYNQLAREDITIFKNLRFFLIGGDLVEPTYVCELKKMYPHIMIFHMYGPTENTTFSTFFEVDKEYDKLPIGKPLKNSSVYVLNNNNQLQPHGIEGEICVGGDGVTRGYLNNIELTNKKYIHNLALTNGMIFKTGDLGKWNEDGNLEFLGRIDNQVKIRGFRIEIDEIESLLLKHNKINSVVVVVKEGIESDKHLIAYFVSDKELELSELRGFLRKSLPDYMIPSFFMHMEKLPLSPNGKIDRQALPIVDGSICSGVEYVAPKNVIQEKLVRIWQEVLDIEKIGIRDNFFELGGHSLKATRVISRISKKLEVDIALRDIFESQTVETLSDLIEKAKRKGYKQIEVATERDYYDVSNAQKRLWVLDQFEKDSIAYNMLAAFILEGKLNTDAFSQAYSFMIERHESLRTVFVSEDGEPKQKILKNPDFDIEIIDLRNSSDVEEGRVLAEKDLHAPFHLEVGPLVRFTIMQLEDEKYLLLFNMHHIISDGWSMSIFIKEILTSYESFGEGKTPELAPLRIQYKDYSAWQNDLFDSPGMDNQREYWLDKLSGDLPVLDLPADKFRPVTQTFNGNSIGFVLSGEINAGLNDLSLENKTSLFMMLQALVKVLFHRYTGQTDIILGSPIAGRVHKDLENQIGFYVNTLGLRDAIEGDLTFKEILGRVKKTCTDAFDNQDYPFDRIVEELDIKRDMSRSPLFDVMVILQNNDEVSVEFDGLNILSYKTENTISKFDMSFNFSESDNSLLCSIEYNTDIYSEERIKRMVEHLEILISSVLGNPEARIKDLEIIPEEEKDLLLNVFNNTKADYPSDKTIVDLFEQQVEKTPDNIAVVFENIDLTYRELNKKANIVGHYLRDNYNIEPDDLVGVLMERSEKMIIALLGILKAGGAYVPLDSEYPVDRIEYMLEDSCPKVVISERNKFTGNSIEILDVNEILQSNNPNINPDNVSKSSNLAYVIYTSGSTGKPKGVLSEHRGVINLIESQKIKYMITEDERILQFSNICFDASVEQIWLALLSGVSLVFISKEIQLSHEKFNSYICEKKITHFSTVPSFLRDIELTQNNHLKRIILGGEDFPMDFARRYYGEIELFNSYGPTETTVTSICYRLDSLSNEQELIPIGNPILNTRVYILDEDSNLLPLGVPGELCISGSGLARGYLNRPELTAERFVDNPFVPGQRMYRTGDLARWVSDGNIEFLGRIDNQVKIRGFRIELGEIENSIVQHNEISSAVVVAKEDIKGDKQLIAYYVSDKELELSELRSFLSKSLPDYMIPSYFVLMETLPLTPNGKIDRKAMPEVDGSISSGVEYVAPRNKPEEKLVAIWQEVLGIEKIGVHDNFFNLGGHSLKAIKLISNINKIFDYQLQLREIFEKSTVSDLAELIGSGSISKEETILVPIQPNGLKKPIFLVPGSMGDVLCFSPLSQSLGEDQPVYGLQSVGLDGISKPIDSIEKMAELYIQSIKSVQEKGPYQIGGHSFGGKVAFEICRQLQMLGDDIESLMLIDSYPHNISGEISFNEHDQFLSFLSQISKLYEIKLDIDIEKIIGENEEGRWIYIKKILEENEIFLPIEMIKGKWNVNKTNCTIKSSPQIRLNLDKVILFKAKEGNFQEDDLSWSNYISSEIKSYGISGNHFTMLDNPNVEEITDVLKKLENSKELILSKLEK